jgi:hypothetical protein
MRSGPAAPRRAGSHCTAEREYLRSRHRRTVDSARRVQPPADDSGCRMSWTRRIVPSGTGFLAQLPLHRCVTTVPERMRSHESWREHCAFASRCPSRRSAQKRVRAALRRRPSRSRAFFAAIRPSSSPTLPVRRHTQLTFRAIACRSRLHIAFSRTRSRGQQTASWQLGNAVFPSPSASCGCLLPESAPSTRARGWKSSRGNRAAGL